MLERHSEEPCVVLCGSRSSASELSLTQEMSILICLVKVACAWVAMMLIGSNLIGFIVRGLLGQGIPAEPPDSGSAANTWIVSERKRMKVSNLVMTVLAVGACAGYYWALFQYLGGVLAVIAGAMLMVSRLPDLLVEIRAGKPTTRKSMSRTPLDFFMTALTWAALPVMWFALCYQK